MPLRSVKMNRFIFGFQRRVWCPKWTPLSSSCFMLTTAMVAFLVARDPGVALSRFAAGHRVVHRPGVRPRHTTRRFPVGTEVAAVPRERGEDARSRPVETGR